ncbi:MAG: tail fiber protein [Phycisphaerae bacterium]|nr:tail fiber protein [Phycisphaerae bacterium]
MKTRTIIGIVAVALSALLLFQRSDTQGALEAPLAADMPAGSILAYARSEPPEGWLLCDGELYEVDDYPELFAVLEFTYGGNPAKTAFRVPDLTGRIPVGADPTRWYCKDLGQTGGEEEVTLTEDQMPSHRHDVSVASHTHEISVSPHTHAIAVAAHTHSIIDPGHSHSVSDPGHSHGVTDPGHSHTIWLHDHLGQGQVDDSGVNHRGDTETGSSKTGISVNKAYTNMSINKATTGIAVGQTSPTASAANTTVSASAQSVVVGVSEASKGSDAAHSNLQPYLVVNYIIKCR